MSNCVLVKPLAYISIVVVINQVIIEPAVFTLFLILTILIYKNKKLFFLNLFCCKKDMRISFTDA